MLRRNPFLNVTKRVGETNQLVTRVELERRVNAGIQWRSIGDGMVPIFEEHSVRIQRNFTVEQWEKLEPMERAIVIAEHRIDNAMKGHYAEAESRQMRQDAKRKGAK